MGLRLSLTLALTSLFYPTAEGERWNDMPVGPCPEEGVAGG